MQSITKSEGGQNIMYGTTYNGDQLSKLSTVGGQNELAGDVVFKYSGSNVTSLETWVKAGDDQLYQVGHFTFTYDGSGDLNKSEIHFDFVALFTISFGQIPTDPYAPAFFGSVEYEYGQDNAPNPLNGIYYMNNPDMGFMKNMPINIIRKDSMT